MIRELFDDRPIVATPRSMYMPISAPSIPLLIAGMLPNLHIQSRVRSNSKFFPTVKESGEKGLLYLDFRSVSLFSFELLNIRC